MVYRITKTALTKTALFMPVPVRRILQMMPPLPRFEDQPPRLPRTGEPQPLETKLILGQTTGLLILVILLVKLNALLSMMVLIAGLVAIVVMGQYQRQGYQRRRLAYSQQMEAYFQELEVYSRREGQNQREIAQRHSPERVWQFRQRQLAQFWQESPPQVPQYLDRDLDRGAPISAENSDLLNSAPEPYRGVISWLQNLVTAGNSVKSQGTWLYRPRIALAGFHQGYEPDFLYIAEGRGVVLLVEVMGLEQPDLKQPDLKQLDFEQSHKAITPKIPATDRLLLQESVLRQGWFLLYVSADGDDWDNVAASLGEIFHPPVSPEPKLITPPET
jgi:hypothetical protein